MLSILVFACCAPFLLFTNCTIYDFSNDTPKCDFLSNLMMTRTRNKQLGLPGFCKQTE